MKYLITILVLMFSLILLAEDSGVVLEEITLAHSWGSYYPIKIYCSTPEDSKYAGKHLEVAVGNPYYNYLSALSDWKNGKKEGMGDRYHYLKAELSPSDCSFQFPMTGGIVPADVESKEYVIFKLSGKTYLLTFYERDYKLEEIAYTDQPPLAYDVVATENLPITIKKLVNVPPITEIYLGFRE